MHPTPSTLAGEFLRFFGIRGRPDLDSLTRLLRRAEFGEVTGRCMDTLKGIHYSSPNGGYDIHYHQELWDGAKEHTVLHEAYEIIHETLSDMASGSQPGRNVCREADRFAAAALMRRDIFAPYAEASGLDVIALQRRFRCSYASVGLRLAEVVQHRPPDGRALRAEGQGRPFRLDRAGRSASGSGKKDAAVRDAPLPAVERLAGRDASRRKGPSCRVSCGAGGRDQRFALWRGRRRRRGRKACRLEGASRQAGCCRGALC